MRRGGTPAAGSRARARRAVRARSALPSREPESTTTTSTSSSTRWRAIASRQRTRSAPPSFTGMTTEIIGELRPADAVVSRRSGMVSSARKNAPNTIWMPSPSAVTSSAVSYARPSAPKPLRAHSTATHASPTTANSASAPPATRPCSSVTRASEPLEQRVPLADPHPRVCPREDAELDHLRADQRHRDEARASCGSATCVRGCRSGPSRARPCRRARAGAAVRPARGRASSGCTGA